LHRFRFETGAYLIKFPNESDAKYANRQELGVYPNYVSKIVDIYSGFLWQREPIREGPDLYARFTANANGAGKSLNWLLQVFQRQAMLLGTVYVLVDKSERVAATRADDRGVYVVMRSPDDLIGYVLDGMGGFARCCFSEIQDGVTRYRHFDAEGWKISSDARGEHVLAEGSYGFGRPPVVALHSTIPLREGDVEARPWVYPLAQLNWDLYNQCSELRWLFRSQAFAMLKLPVKDRAERDRLAQMVIGPNNALAYDPSDGGEPGFIAPPPEPVTAYQANIAATIERIYALANLEFVGGVQQSGVALAFHFQEANRTLGMMAANLEQAERQIAGFVCAWNGIEFQRNIAYPRDFNLTDLAQELTLAMESVQLGVSPTFDQEVKKRVARQVLGHGVQQATMDQIDREIEAGGDIYGDRAAKAAA